MDLGNDVSPVDGDRLGLRCPKGDVKYRPIFGDIDLLAAKHVVDLLTKVHHVSQL